MIEPGSKNARLSGAFAHRDYSQRSEFSYANFKIKIKVEFSLKVENNIFLTILSILIKS